MYNGHLNLFLAQCTVYGVYGYALSKLGVTVTDLEYWTMLAILLLSNYIEKTLGEQRLIAEYTERARAIVQAIEAEINNDDDKEPPK